MDHASENGNAPDVAQDAALLCFVSDQMHLDAHQDTSVFAPHLPCGRFRSTAAIARCRSIGESSNHDTERDSRKRHALGKSQQSEETHHSANCPCCSGSIRTRGKHATAGAGSATPTRLCMQPAGLQQLLQPKSACNPASQIATCPYSSLPSKGSHLLPRGSCKTRCTNLVHSAPLSANTATTPKQKPRSAASPASSMCPPSPTEHRPRSATKPAYSRHHSAGQVRGEKADSAAEAELNTLRQENAKLHSQLARLRSLRSQEEAARNSPFPPDMPQAPASPPPWLSDKAADTNEPFSPNTQTSRSIKHALGMSPAPVKRRKANPHSQVSPSRGIQAGSDQRHSKLTCNSKLKQQEAGRCITPRRSSGSGPLPVIPPITVTDTHSQAFQLHTPKHSTAKIAHKPALREQALQPSPDMPGVRFERPNSSGRSEAGLTQSPSLLQPQTWSPNQSQLSWQSPLTPLCQNPSQTQVQPQRVPLDTKGGSALHLAATAADEAADEAAGDMSQLHGTPHAFTMGSNPQAAELRQLSSDFHTQLAGLTAVPLLAEPIQAPSPATDQLPAVDGQPAGLNLTSNPAPVEQMISAQRFSPSLTQTQPDLQQPRAGCGKSAAAEPFQLPSESPLPTQSPSKDAKAGQTSAADERCNTHANTASPAPQALPSPQRASVRMTVNADIDINGAGLAPVSMTHAGDLLSQTLEHVSSTVQAAQTAAPQLPAADTDAKDVVSPSAAAGDVHAGGLVSTFRGQTALGPGVSQKPDTKSKVSDSVAVGGSAGSQSVRGRLQVNGHGRSSSKPAGSGPAAVESEAPARDQVVNPTPLKRKAGQPKKRSNVGKLLTPAASKQTSTLTQPEVARAKRGRTADQLPAPEHDLDLNQCHGKAGRAKHAGATGQSAAAAGHQTPASSRRRSSRVGLPGGVSGPGPQLRSLTFSTAAEAKQPLAATADQRTGMRFVIADHPKVGRKTKQVPAAVSQKALRACAVTVTASQVIKAGDSLAAISEQAGGMSTGVVSQPNQTSSSDKPIVASIGTAAKLQAENCSQLLPAGIASDLSQGMLAQTDRAARTEFPNREMVEMAVSSYAVESEWAGAAVVPGGKRAMPHSPLVKPAAKRHASATRQGLNPKFMATKEQVARLIGDRRDVFESELRRSMGNNPDTSKALRKLWQEGVLDRGGIGGRMDPFRYSRKTLGAV